MLWASFACHPRSVYLMSLYSWLWNVAFGPWHHRLNINVHLTIGYYECCLVRMNEWYLENVQQFKHPLSLFVSFPGLCTMNALYTCMASLSASFCSGRHVCIVFIGSGWRWGLWMYQSTQHWYKLNWKCLVFWYWAKQYTYVHARERIVGSAVGWMVKVHKMSSVCIWSWAHPACVKVSCV